MYQGRRLAILSAIYALTATVVVLFTAGCAFSPSTGAGSSTPTSPILSPGGISGSVHGGQQPVVGATIQLYEVGVTSYTTGKAKPILTTTVTTQAGGSFSISGDYSCDSGTYVYITAAGGNPGVGGTPGTNANLAEMAALGPCSVLLANANTTFISISEETTVAAAYALAQFSGNTNFGTPLSSQGGVAGTSAPADNFTSSSSNVQGIANAMAIAQVITNNTTGTSPGSNSDGAATPEWWQVNTLADLLAACINSTGTTTGAGDGTNCGTLFANVNIPSGTNPATGLAYTAPADTIQAAIYMALNPTISSTQQTNLFGLLSASSPYQPYVASASKLYDLTVAISYLPVVPSTTTTLLAQPTKVAIDSYGNAWVTNNPTTAAANGFVVELDPTGNPIQAGSTSGTSASNYQITGYSVGGAANTTLAGLNNGSAAPVSFPFIDEAIDTNNNIWLPDYMKSNVVKITDSGAAYTSSGYATSLHNGGNGNDSGGNGAIGYALPTSGGGTGNGTTSVYPMTIAVDESNDVFVTTNAGTAGTSEALACATYTSSSGVSTSGDKGLLTFVGGSATNIQSGRFVGAPQSPIAIDGGTTDKISGTAIPGSPFVWGLGYNQGGENASLGGSSYAGLLSQNYTTASGANSQFSNSSQMGCPTPLSYLYVSSSSTDIGISSTLDSSAVTQISGALGTNGANTTQVTVVPSDVGNGDAAAYMMGSPYGLAIDGSGNLWVSNTSYDDSTSSTAGSGSNGTIKTSLTKITPSYGSSFTAANAASNFAYTVYHDMAGISTSGSSQPRLLAADGGGNIWFALSPTGGTVGAITSSGTAFSPSYASTNIGFVGSACPSTCDFTNTSTAYTRSNGPKQIAIDASGNVWIPQQGSNSNEVTVIVGSAVPLATPSSLSIKNSTFGQKP